MSVVALPLSPPGTSSRKERVAAFSIPPTSTPDDSPASTGPPSSLGLRKKVNFSPWANEHHPVKIVDGVVDTEVRVLPPSRECAASHKSILKANVQENGSRGGQDGPSDEPQSVAEAMESIVQQLIRNDHVECVDAYQTLTAAVKAYDDLPEQTVLRSQLHLITKAMKQHLTVLDRSDYQPSDINLVTSALKVLVILVWNSDFSPHLSDTSDSLHSTEPYPQSSSIEHPKQSSSTIFIFWPRRNSATVS
ncbi:uncharacterized protein AB675_589 [Cyphellophora attinorum]|uniref:Telomere-associated protein Rif1 N-terminal domain-containing protein n=1 Tax=Cyphellophora attinorum TaxID=1664694 RepID=A0A0N1HHJ0_9EURO|nr:uncharacterized protein AB675_589 [Phialophora attinorum]KPI45495.1 hypothetical protein AB675_589 [Phialophora attinorum]